MFARCRGDSVRRWRERMQYVRVRRLYGCLRSLLSLQLVSITCILRRTRCVPPAMFRVVPCLLWNGQYFLDVSLVSCSRLFSFFFFFFFSSRRRHTRFDCDWSSDVCSSD